MLTDHIYNSVERSKKGFYIDNALLSEIRKFYKEEFFVVVQEIVKLANERFKVELIDSKAGFITFFATPIMAFLNPFFLGTGLGSANFPIMLMSYIQNGCEALILAAALAGNTVQAGAGFAIAFKSKNKELKSVAAECGVTALMGIAEQDLA